MRSRFVAVLLTTFLLGCSVDSAAPASADFAPAASGTGVAWGERVAFINPVARLKVFGPDGKLLTQQTFQPAKAAVDLPPVPTFPVVGLTQDPIDKATFLKKPSASDQLLDTNRGSVEIVLTDGSTKRLQPYGSVQSGRVHLLAGVSRPCSQFFDFLRGAAGTAFSQLATLGVPDSGSSNLCHVTLDVGGQDTAAALGALAQAATPYPHYTSTVSERGFVLDKDALTNLDPPGSGSKSFDPSCEQITKVLDPTGERGYSLVSMPKLVADVGSSTSGLTGQGIQVVIIGGGLEQNDDIKCGTMFRLHDTHIKRVIQRIAPSVTFTEHKVCNSEGTCSSAEIVRALMNTLLMARQNLPNPRLIVSMSLGGRIPERVTFQLLRLLGQRFAVPIPVVVSAGNAPFAPAHYPASFSSGIPGALNISLPNVIPVAAVGYKLDANSGKPGYVIPAFNTRANAVLFAPGVNLCPQTAEAFRCKGVAPYPTDLGITGTSFAVATATGLAALYTEKKGSLPSRLGRCLFDNVRSDPVTGTEYIAYGNAACP